ncbi:HPr family phosphocarrier protein [Spiroplasma endosymbiont of 'Nebria riversi']|uniref:HPr family phosphocarrier protein n=1 Tax=Spiroplasma endosymbiont of 'Nebria riversi' TaxID=2792084 RepID=UPI001C05BA5B|nr:HPr family phosphocarrier protein [Spiroplasma endosymbiont of 'Nebria riversi']
MSSFKAKITDPIGIHARPAAIIVKEASKYSSTIKIKVNGCEGNLKSIMNIMALGIKTGTEVEIEAIGKDADVAIAGIKKAMKDNKLV